MGLNSCSQGWKIFPQNGLSYAGSRYLISFFLMLDGLSLYAGTNDLTPPYVRPRNFFFLNTLSRGTATYKLSFPRHLKRRKVKKIKKKKVSKLLVGGNLCAEKVNCYTFGLNTMVSQTLINHRAYTYFPTQIITIYCLLINSSRALLESGEYLSKGKANISPLNW